MCVCVGGGGGGRVTHHMTGYGTRGPKKRRKGVVSDIGVSSSTLSFFCFVLFVCFLKGRGVFAFSIVL